MSISILQYDNYLDFLNDLKNQFPGRKKSLTLQQISKILGYRSPRTYAMILKGQRQPSFEMIHAISKVTGMTDKEKVYFDLLVRKTISAKKHESSNELEAEISKHRRKPLNKKQLSAEVFRSISEWYHSPIWHLQKKGMSALDIQKHLKMKLSLNEIQQAMGRLDYLNLPQAQAVMTTIDVPSQAIRSHHSQMMEQAERALLEDSTMDREFTSMSVAFPKNRIQEAKKMINEFLADFEERFHSEDSQTIHQIGIYLFQHTKDEE